MISFRNNFVFLFFLKFFLLYIGWYFVYDLWLHPQGMLDISVVKYTAIASKFILELMGYNVFMTVRLIGIEGTSGLWIGDNCNGISLFAIFSAFIIAFPGSWIRKIVFIPLGIISIQLLNIIRVVGLAIIETYSYELTQFNHTYTFTILIYGYIFFLWMLWVSKFSGIKSRTIDENKNF